MFSSFSLLMLFSCSSLLSGFRLFLFRRGTVGLLIACWNDYPKARRLLLALCMSCHYLQDPSLCSSTETGTSSLSMLLTSMVSSSVFFSVFLTMKVKGNHYWKVNHIRKGEDEYEYYKSWHFSIWFYVLIIKKFYTQKTKLKINLLLCYDKGKCFMVLW